MSNLYRVMKAVLLPDPTIKPWAEDGVPWHNCKMMTVGFVGATDEFTALDRAKKDFGPLSIVQVIKKGN